MLKPVESALESGGSNKTVKYIEMSGMATIPNDTSLYKCPAGRVAVLEVLFYQAEGSNTYLYVDLHNPKTHPSGYVSSIQYDNNAQIHDGWVNTASNTSIPPWDPENFQHMGTSTTTYCATKKPVFAGQEIRIRGGSLTGWHAIFRITEEDASYV